MKPRPADCECSSNFTCRVCLDRSGLTLSHPEVFHRARITFIGRENGALGKVYPIVAERNILRRHHYANGELERQARALLYRAGDDGKRYESVTDVSVEFI